MKIELIKSNLSKINRDCEIVFVVNKNLKHKWVVDSKALKSLNFTGTQSEVATVENRIYIGVDFSDIDDMRIASAKAIQTLNKLNFKSAKVGIYGDSDRVRAMVEGFILGNYKFDKYKSQKFESKLKKVSIALESFKAKKLKSKDIESSIESAKVIATSVNFTRDIVNSMPDELTPKELAKIAKKVAKESKLDCIIEDEKFLKKEGMNAFLAVTRASTNGPRLIHLTHKPKRAKRKVVIVGKGLTYDSGGLSLKPSNFMLTMKADKSGACATLGAIQAVAKLNLPIEVHAIIGACENMVGGDAYKPDDVLVAKNGTSIEVKNTDAEGRLVLADCLCYAQNKIKNIDNIFDIATLTGACVVALGEYTTGVMGFNEKLKESILNSSQKSGELSASLPFNKYLEKLLTSEVADISNVSSGRYGGAITAGLFLSNFIKRENRDKWVHLDIAGPAFVEKPWGYNPYGASGAGVRLLTQWLKDISK